MSRFLTWRTLGLCLLSAGLAVAVLLATPAPVAAQATISTGSIQGTILDQQGAVVSSAKVTITNKAIGQKIRPVVTSTGTYNSGALLPGDYVVRVEATGFRTLELPVTVLVGVISSGNVTLQVGSEATVVTVESSAVQVNTEQAAVQGVMTTQQIEQLPINGRNFLDLAQLEPGVQIQDGGNFDPTKNGFSSISFAGRFGRTARIEVDGIDISDETVGTTTQNIPQVAIKEFQISQSTLDLSTELTSSGAVNVVTHSGTNSFHGEGFFYGRSDQISARFAPKQLDFGRKQYGVRFGGPFIKEKLFFLGAWERTQQDLAAPVTLSKPFDVLTGNFNSPFRDNQFLGRLDYQIKPGWTVFYRFSYEQNRNVSPFIPNTFSPFANLDNTPVHAGGIDFTTGSFTHSIRAGYTKFRNGITDAVTGTNIFNPAPQIELAIGSSTFCTMPGSDVFCSGPNILAPQKTFQSNKQFKYDGSKIIHSHILRYGTGVNRILGGGFASFVGIAPAVRSSFTQANRDFANCIPGSSCTTPFASGGDSNPLNYPVSRVILGNGQGFFTDIPEFGLPAGGQFDTRFQWYAGDTWKLKPNFTLNYGVRYVRDTGRGDQDLPPIPCSASTLITCTGNLLDQFGPGLGNRVRQPNKNFGPQLGIAWDPWKSGKTVFRAGTGIYYENAVFNNILFDRPARLAKGLFFGTAGPCPSGQLPLPDGTVINTSNICGKAIGSVASQIAALQTQFQQATVKAGPQANGSFMGNILADGVDSTGNQLLAPDYRTVYSFQLNAGIQRQIGRGTVLSVDYLRQVGLHQLLGIDTNHVGDARFLNKNAALNAINATNASFNCPAGPAGISCAIGRGATIVDYAGNGLDSGVSLLSGTPASVNLLTPDTGAAFPGINPNVGQNQMLFPIGRSVYNAMQVKLTSKLGNPLPGLKNLNLQVAYALGRFRGQSNDQDFINNATDFNNPLRFIGPNSLDRTHQLSAGAVVDFPLATRVSFITHWYTALPVTMTLPATNDPGEIFRTDVTGDGTTSDVLPGTNIGAFGREVKLGDLNNVLTSYSNTAGGKLTPAAQALVSAGLFTPAQLIQLCAYTPSLSLPTGAPATCTVVNPLLKLALPGQVGLDAFFTFDMRFGWVIRPGKKWASVPENITIEPQIGVFNLFNRHNYDSPRQPLLGQLNGNAGSINGTTKADRSNLIGLGSGVNAGGAPRQFEFGVKVTF